jgi:aryl-alcohol dehydrogenase-like predicted oxidoreductase
MLNEINHKFLLGGATLGNQYGVSNTVKMTDGESLLLIEEAFQQGFLGIDTAPVYGNSESVCGSSNLRNKEVFTKVLGSAVRQGLEEGFEEVKRSLKRLQVEKLTGITFHSSDDFTFNTQTSIDLVQKLLDCDLVESWGVSMYSPKEISKILDHAKPDYVQAPVNIADRRFIDSSVTATLRQQDIALHARSVYLQGILLQDPATIHEYFSPWKTQLSEYQSISNANGLSLLGMTVASVLELGEVTRVVVGANNISQLQQMAEQLKFVPQKNLLSMFKPCSDEALIDPRLWNTDSF